MAPKVSIIIPVYNVARYLPECLQSVCDQPYKNLEIIVVNDGSPDNSGDIIDRFAARDKRIVHLKKENGGLPSARKSGTAIATGDFIIHLDGDDFLAEDAVGMLVQRQQQTEADMIFGDFFEQKIKETSLVNTCLQDVDPNALSGADYLRQVVCGPANKMGYVWGRLYKKELLQNIKYQRTNLEEDVFMMFQIATRCGKIAHLPQGICYYRRNSDSITCEAAEKFQNAHIDHCLAMCGLLPTLDSLPQNIIQERMVSYLRSIGYYFCICRIDERSEQFQKLRTLYHKILKLYPAIFRQNILSSHLPFFIYVALTLRLPFMASWAYAVSATRRTQTYL